MILSFIILAFTLLLLPAYLLNAFWRGVEPSRLHWFLRALYVGGFLLFIFIIGRWDWLGYYLRYVWIGVFLVTLYVSYQKVKSRPWVNPAGSFWQANGSRVFELVIVAAMLAFALRGFFYPPGGLQMAFPLRDGRYYVAHGGASVLMNYHNSNRAQRYALDIVALNPIGLRANGVYPAALTHYTIYGHTVYSPCSGQVVSAVGDLPDQTPPETNRENPAGNHLVIACQEVLVVLAHLQPGSLLASPGDSVAVGQPLGKVGNSGNTSEPHLHIHAVRSGSVSVLDGEGVPLLFENRFLTRNALHTGAQE